jgi:hypothetical protein
MYRNRSTPIIHLSKQPLNTIFQMGKRIDEAKGYGREIQLILEDYCHFLGLIYWLCGDKRELYGRE